MAFISVTLIVVGFIISVYTGIVLALPGKVLTPSGEVSQSKVTWFSILMSISVLMQIAGVLGYYWLRDNLPYYVN